MKHIKTCICTALAVLLTGAAFSAAANHTDEVVASAEGAATYSVKTYVPDQYDTVNYYGGAGDIAPENGDGVTTFAHAGIVTPLQGTNIQMNTQFKLLSKNAVENGGDGIDGWVTYSFSKTPASIDSDTTYPYYGGTTPGYFLHITNYSGSTAPNCVEVQFVKSVDGTMDNMENVVGSFWLDNAVNTPITLSLAKAEDGFYDLSFTRISDSTVLKKVEDVTLDESLFINDLGQTFFSTAIYEAAGCDGNHWEHRGVAVFSMQAYTQDITAADVVLSQDSYELTEGGSCSPQTTVTVNGVVLEAGVDYDVTYVDNAAVGTAKAVLTFYGVYGGNVVEKTFTITEPAPETPDTSDSSDSSSATTSDASDSVSASASESEEENSGCGSAIGFGAGVLALLACGGVALVRRKEN